jgi:hypothetical protein
MNDWAGTGPVNIKLNTKYLPSKMTPQELQALTASLQSGSISPQTFFYNLKQGELIAEDVEFETEREQRQSSGVPLGVM